MENPHRIHRIRSVKKQYARIFSSRYHYLDRTLSRFNPPLSCILALGDNTSAVGWLHKVNVDDTINKALHLTSRKLATGLMEADCCLYSQHFKGEFNEVADCLSRRHDLSDNQLLSFILSRYPEQVPATFAIDHLPPSITSWMTCLLQKNKDLTEFSNKHETKKRERGTDGNPTSDELKTPTIPSYYSLNPSPTRHVFKKKTGQSGRRHS